MKFVTFEDAGKGHRVGILADATTAIDISLAATLQHGQAPACLSSMVRFIEAGDTAMELAAAIAAAPPADAMVDLQSVRLLAPLPRPPRLRDAGLFVEHLEIIRKEMARIAAQSAPDPEARLAELLSTDQFRVPDIVYNRACYYNGNHLAIIGPDAPLAWPRGVSVLDYELELAIVVGQAGENLSAAGAKSHVFGYTVMNDWSARDVQVAVSKSGAGPCMGKDFATSLGPCIVTADEIPDPHALDMEARLNGQVLSRGSTRNMHHNIFAALAEFSQTSPIVSGEVIGSGTPAFGSASECGRRLKPGDRVDMEITGIGTLSNLITNQN